MASSPSLIHFSSGKTKASVTYLNASHHGPQRRKGWPHRRVRQNDGEHRHEQKKKSRRRRPAHEVQGCGLHAMAEGAEHRLRESVFVPRSLIAAAVQKERRRHDHAAAVRAFQILLHLRLRCFGCCRVHVVTRRQIELPCDLLEIVRRESRPALHEGVVDRPEFARRLEGILRQLAPRVWQCHSLPPVDAGRRIAFARRSDRADRRSLRARRDRTSACSCRIQPASVPHRDFPGCDHDRDQPEDRALSDVREP